MFKQAITKDKSLLEFFSLIINGMSDNFIQKNIERLKLQIILNKISTIQQDVDSIKELMNELISHLPPEFQFKEKKVDQKLLKISALFYELKSIGESRKRKQLSKKIEKKVIEDDEPLYPSSIKDLNVQVHHEYVKEELLTPYGKRLSKIQEMSHEEHDEMDVEYELKPIKATVVDSFDENVVDNDREISPPQKYHPAPGRTISDHMIATPKLKTIVGNHFLRKTTIQNSGFAESAEQEASITRQIVSKLNSVYSKLDTLKGNLAHNEGAIKDQIGSRMAIDVKKNMGVAATEVSSNNKMLFILHDSWAVMASMMMGIQKSTNSLLNQSFVLKDTDFKLQYTFELRPAQVSSKDNEIDAYSKSIFFDYAPYVFKEIRQIFQISSKSVCQFYLVS